MTGRCFCGGFAFEFDRPITDIEICYCLRGERAPGSPFAAEVRLRADKFRWPRGEELVAFCDAPIVRDPPRMVDPSAGLWFPAAIDFPETPSVAIPTGRVDATFPLARSTISG